MSEIIVHNRYKQQKSNVFSCFPTGNLHVKGNNINLQKIIQLFSVVNFRFWIHANALFIWEDFRNWLFFLDFIFLVFRAQMRCLFFRNQLPMKERRILQNVCVEQVHIKWRQLLNFWEITNKPKNSVCCLRIVARSTRLFAKTTLKKQNNWHLGHTFTYVKWLFIWINALIIWVWRIGNISLNIWRTESLPLRDSFCRQWHFPTPNSSNTVSNCWPLMFVFTLVHFWIIFRSLLFLLLCSRSPQLSIFSIFRTSPQ